MSAVCPLAQLRQRSHVASDMRSFYTTTGLKESRRWVRRYSGRGTWPSRTSTSDTQTMALPRANGTQEEESPYGGRYPWCQPRSAWRRWGWVAGGSQCHGRCLWITRIAFGSTATTHSALQWY